MHRNGGGGQGERWRVGIYSDLVTYLVEPGDEVGTDGYIAVTKHYCQEYTLLVFS